MSKRTGIALVLLAILISPLECFSQQPVHWDVTLDSALRVAGQTNRLVLIEFWAPWCTFCKRMDAEVLSEPGVMAELNADYVPVRINADHFPATAKQYGVTGLPTTVIVSPQGQVIETLQGWFKPDDYLSRIRTVAIRAKPSGERLYAQLPPPAAPPPRERVAPPPDQRAGGPALGQMNPNQATAPGIAPPRPAGPQPALVAARPAYVSEGVAPLSDPRQSPLPAMGGPGSTPPGYSQPPNAAPDGWRYGAPPVPTAAPVGYGPPPVRPPQFAAPPPAAPPASPMPSANPPPNNRVQLPPGNPPLGMDGYCPVSLGEKQQWVRGDRRWGVIHRGRTYLFAGPEEQRRFFSDPDHYAPVISGNDIVLATDQGQAVPGMRGHGVYFAGHVYLFSSEESLQRFSTNPTLYASQAIGARAGIGSDRPLR